MSNPIQKRPRLEAIEAPAESTPDRSLSASLIRQSVLPVESTIPTEVTIDEWRRQRRSRPRPRPAADCGHLHDTTTRYDHARNLLTFLLVCPACHTEKVLETVEYEPRFERNQATVHQLPVRRDRDPARRAA
jgi:hypothetical protein